MVDAGRNRASAELPPRWQRALTVAPDTILIPLLWLCVTVTVTVMLRVFTPWLVIPVVLAASALTWRWRPTRFTGRWAWQSSLIALVGAIAWAGVNVPLASRWLTVTRDPGFLTLEGIWLSRHSEPGMPDVSAMKIAADFPGVATSTGAYYPSDGLLNAQGAKLVPGLVAIGGWIGGIEGVLVANLFIGAIALLTVYGFARRMVGPVWSLAATGSLAISMPFIAFTRSVYTEPLVVAVTFAGLTMLWASYRVRRLTGLVTGGALVGAGGLARIDGAAVVIGLILGLALAVLGTTSRARRSELRKYFLLASVPALVLDALGLAELMLDSPTYTAALAPEWHELTAATAGLFVIGILVTIGPPWRWISVWSGKRSRGIGLVVAGVVLVVGLALSTRPFWEELSSAKPSSWMVVPARIVQLLERLQLHDGQANWDDQSLTWVAMYYSWIVVAAALIGVAFAARRALVQRDPRLLVAIAVVAAPSLLYLWSISIAPDQIWAMRRFLPVTLPGFLVFAAWTFRGIASRLLRKRHATRIISAAVVASVSVAGFMFPAVTWQRGNLLTAVQYGGQLNQIKSVCRLLDGRPAVVVGGIATSVYTTIDVVCGSEAIAIPGRMTATQLAAARVALGATQPVLIVLNPLFVPWSGGTTPQPYSTADITTWPNVLGQRPAARLVTTTHIWAGTIDTSGTIEPVSAP